MASPGVIYNKKKTIKRNSITKYFKKGWWTDGKDQPIKETTIGETIRFHLETDNIDDGEKIFFTIYDSDFFPYLEDQLILTDRGTNTESKEIVIHQNKGFIEWTTGAGSQALTQEDWEGDELELYVKCTYNNETVNLPNDSDDYLILYEKEVLITVLIELPHSKETGWGAKGLAGHSAMAIGERYFDYGPNNTPGTYSENQYDVDFNGDGDKNDNVYLDNPSFMNSPGQPWWGTHIAERKGINPEQVTLSLVKEYIKLYWNDIKDPITNVRTHRGTFIYGKVHTIEFYVKESEANKMIKWWEERYKHLKVYSVKPWAGEQCTTTVKTAIQQAFPFQITKPIMNNYIPDTTQTPKGLLEDLQAFFSTSKQHKDQHAAITVIKEEAIDFQ